MSGLLELAERCEQAAGPSKSLDIAIADALGLKVLNGMGRAVYLHNSPRGAFSPSRYTASLDAAMTLVPEGATSGVFTNFGDGGCKAFVGIEVSKARTAPLALCAAALKARAALVDTHPKDGDVKQAPLVSGAVPKADAQKQSQ